MCSRSRGAMRPSFARPLSLLEREGAGKTGCTLHPRSHVQDAQSKRTRAYRFSGNTPAFPAQWFYGLYRALLGDRLDCHRRPREALASHELDASIGASGPHDFAVRVAPFVLRAPARPPHPAPYVRDDRDTPLLWARDGRAGSADLPDGESGIFFAAGLDRILVICPTGQICMHLPMRAPRFAFRRICEIRA
jgi:hypothetical protein